jgi:hypothetical protein
MLSVKEGAKETMRFILLALSKFEDGVCEKQTVIQDMKSHAINIRTMLLEILISSFTNIQDFGYNFLYNNRSNPIAITAKVDNLSSLPNSCRNSFAYQLNSNHSIIIVPFQAFFLGMRLIYA